MSLLNAELSGKGLQLLKEAVPAASRVAVLWSSANPLHEGIRAATEAAAATLKVRLQLLDVRGPEDLRQAFDAITRSRAEGLLALPDTVTLAHRKPILDFAASRRLPALYAFREMVQEGGLMCYGASLAENLRQAADYVDRILKGTPARNPADRPADQIRASHQPQDGQGARSDPPALTPPPGRPGDRVTASPGPLEGRA